MWFILVFYFFILIGGGGWKGEVVCVGFEFVDWVFLFLFFLNMGVGGWVIVCFWVGVDFDREECGEFDGESSFFIVVVV